MKHARILIAGYYGHANVGDEAILEGMLEDLRQEIPATELTVASADPRATSDEHGVAVVDQHCIPGLVAAVRDADLVILGGGGLFQDYWPASLETLLTSRQGGLVHYLSLPVLAALLGKPVMAYAVGVGPLRTAEGRRLTRIAFELFQRATVRDPESSDVLRDCGVDPSAIEVVADAAFRHEPTGGEEAVSPSGDALSRPVLGVSLRHWDFGVDPDAWEAEVASALEGFLAETGGSIRFLPFQELSATRYSDDRVVCLRVCSRLRDRSRVSMVSSTGSPTRAAAAVAECDLLLAMRLHAVVLALRAGRPVVNLAYDDKTSNLMRRVGMGELALRPRAWRAPEIRAALAEAPARRPAAGVLTRLAASARRSATIAGELLRRGPLELDEAERLLRWLAVDRSILSLERDATGDGTNGPRSLVDLRFETLLADRLELQTGELRQSIREAESRTRALLTAQEDRWRSDNRELRRRSERDRSELAREGKARIEAEARARSAQARIERLEEQAESAARRTSQLREQERQLRATAISAASRLEALERARMVRLVHRFWQLVDQLLPPGSARRQAYRRLRDAVVGSDGGRSGGQIGRLDAGQAVPAATELQDEILRFQERLATSRGSDLVAIFSGTQLREDEGQRPTQLALELVRREIPVVFVYWRWSNSELCAQDRLDDGILQLPTDLVTTRPDGFSRLFAGRRRIALFEFPHPSFFHLNAALNSAGWLTVYDVLDDWKEFHRVGQAVWYDEDFERHLITSSDAVFAVNGLLAERIRGLGGAWVEVVPNGFRPGIERADRPWPLTRGEITVGYFGYLAAAWFDWKLVGEAARREPSWRFYLVGYGQPGIESLPENVVLLGKQPQSRLAALAANWDVAIIPFKAERLAAGADPVKTYEYLAMGLPVVSTGVYPPRGAESFVTRADGVEDFLETIRRCAVDGSAVEVQRRRNHALSCTWSTRVSTVLESLQAKRQRVGQKLHLFGSSPALDAHAISAVEPTR